MIYRPIGVNGGILSSILVADDEKSMVEMLEIMLHAEGYDVFTAHDTAEAVEKIGKNSVDLVISDMKIPKDGGIAILRAALQKEASLPVIMITAYASAESAVEAMKLGACDYITKPFSVDELKIVVKNALEKRGLMQENVTLKKALREKSVLKELSGSSAAIKAIRDLVERVAQTTSTILIAGESGTGKELVARALHAHSPRSGKPFLSINCGAMPEQLLESELFGYKKGAFTGAFADKVGLLEAANGGSFFLDEIGEMPLSLQVKLVRAIQEREIRRVGDIKDTKLNVRFIAATNKNLAECVKAGAFREDLYYRLNVVKIEMPPLRERKDDIPLLASRFLEAFNAQNKRDLRGFSPDAMKLIMAHQWPGNVRELENAVEHAVVVESGKSISAESLPEGLRVPVSPATPLALPPEGLDLEERVCEMEKQMITSALKTANGARKEAARLLHMNLRSLRYKLVKYGIR